MTLRRPKRIATAVLVGIGASLSLPAVATNSAFSAGDAATRVIADAILD